MDLASDLLICLTVAALCAGAVRLVALPLPLVQTLAGALLAWPLGMQLELDPHAFLLLLIPPLLFIDGWRIPKHDMRANRRTILLLAFGLVAITVLGVGALIDLLVPSIPTPVAFAIAAALSPTDAVAVAGMTGGVTVPKRLMILLQGEALFNDASGLVSMRVAVAAMLTGAFSWSDALGSFALVATGGTVIGIAMMWGFVRLLRFVFGHDDEAAAGPRVLLLLVFPYAAYIAAEALHLSGILAAASAGMVANRFELVESDHVSTRLQGVAVTHMFEEALNGLVFVLLGLQIPMILREAPEIAVDAQLSAGTLALDIALVIAALLAIRFVWVWVSLSVTIYRMRARGGTVRSPPLRLLLAFSLAGVRGAVTLAAALTLPLTLSDGSRFPAREVAIFVCAIVIVVWLVMASAGLPVLFRGVEIAPSDDRDAFAEARAQLAAAAITAIEQVRDAEQLDEDAIAPLLVMYRGRRDANAAEARDDLELQRRMRMVGLAAERARLLELRATKAVSEELFDQIQRQLDLGAESLAGRH